MQLLISKLRNNHWLSLIQIHSVLLKDCWKMEQSMQCFQHMTVKLPLFGSFCKRRILILQLFLTPALFKWSFIKNKIAEVQVAFSSNLFQMEKILHLIYLHATIVRCVHIQKCGSTCNESHSTALVMMPTPYNRIVKIFLTSTRS